MSEHFKIKFNFRDEIDFRSILVNFKINKLIGIQEASDTSQSIHNTTCQQHLIFQIFKDTHTHTDFLLFCVSLLHASHD